MRLPLSRQQKRFGPLFRPATFWNSRRAEAWLVCTKRIACADGSLEARQRIGRSDSLLWKARLDIGEVATLRDVLLGEDVLRLSANGRGNRTAFVLYAAGADTVRWSWDMSKEVPEPLGAWFRRTWQLCASRAPD